MTLPELTKPLRACLEKIALGKSAQLGSQKGGSAFAVLAGLLEGRGLVRTVKHRDGTRTYALTREGKACLAMHPVDPPGTLRHRIVDDYHVITLTGEHQEKA